jgi:hypothetical protein
VLILLSADEPAISDWHFRLAPFNESDSGEALAATQDQLLCILLIINVKSSRSLGMQLGM